MSQTIIEKVKYLVKELNYNPSEVLVISFTNKTTENLEERMNQYPTENGVFIRLSS
ncbi:UvrD-helicase domain-containing protein [Bacillus sp. es.036]|uniref:UvrD-helicase domain-containing protein n=1 Tax=Bacillus sp. es.036 TaxID=1761764 RepID=UPI0015CF4CA8